MATCFDRWEKDPFFAAAEEVQEAADRMESVYRRWIYERKAASSGAGNGEDVSGELLGELHTALGTAKWQLEELDRAVRSSDEACSAGEDTRTRHSQFVAAIGNQILLVENALRELTDEAGKAMAWVQLDEGERDELALFLSCPLPELEKVVTVPSLGELKVGGNQLRMNGEAECLKNFCDSYELGKEGREEEKVQGHRRAASANADIGVWKISVSDEEAPRRSFDERPNLPPPKISSLSCLTKALESTSRMNLSKNGYRKWKGGVQHQDDEELIPLRNNRLSRGNDACYEKSKSCLSSHGDESYDKQLYGWFGALQRQFQRSQYQIQYGRPIQTILWAILVLVLLVLLALSAI
ncbi:uncharacterized protein [Elaeis guineensis]|uniref:Uncharacterized protein LOC105033246 n=1 Tax=Elaeis guineensis var. tenera TaxID=51953 RepID=A0A6I9QAV1_ELAGV|nr:uncharacterized protein LOC105033246 [Elaeis guineensis]XP_010906265.1 uncharacterized protein LOC105033246 [Elaeis guineensis]XP_010906266.1 uncharacterized protein LOC105033246 [Elaeis guineensis]XP_010906267.1 uncharacterized protein LOC105033246 [Elaeis guineensis]XP_010906268.1 uncharacterized protein LOC105033246 [Elaeis guineensis]XP_019702158.1 uncharacterized protein LOC105033246 [Elaeis guineensis]XP_019702159.1 uncharacterized protein LOC105033246 [Elaeis guineensis]